MKYWQAIYNYIYEPITGFEKCAELAEGVEGRVYNTCRGRLGNGGLVVDFEGWQDGIEIGA